MKRLTAVAAAAVLAAGCVDRGVTDVSQRISQVEPTLALTTESPGLTVMTWNVYYGTDPSPLLQTPPEQVPIVAADIWALVKHTDFPARAGVIAQAIAQKRPDLIGLQEAAVYRIQIPSDAILGGSQPATQVEFDFVALLIDSLAVRGLTYTLVAADSTTDIEVPVFDPENGNALPYTDVRLTDRDAVLARAGVGISNPLHAPYQAAVPVPLGNGIQEGWSSVEATVGGQTYRFVSTHLEIQQFLPVQEAQADELLGLLEDETLPTIVVGDFNSDASGLHPNDPNYETSSYGKFIDAGFADSWLRPAGLPLGLTCCENDSLSNFLQTFDQRVDFIFTRNLSQVLPAGSLVLARQVVGDQRGDRTASGLWPSDHGGVVATFIVPPVRRGNVVTE